MSWKLRDGGYESYREPPYLRGIRGERGWNGAQDRLDALAQRSVIRVGVDLGQSMDYTALAVTQEVTGDVKPEFACRTIERLPLGTSYIEAADRVAHVMRELRRKSDAEKAAGRPGYRLECVVDRSGVGAAVVDLLRERDVRPLVEVVIVAGDTVTERDGDRVNMGKTFMVTRLQVLHEQHRLKVPSTDEAKLFADELRDYRVNTTPAGNHVFNARSGAHDDVIIAVALSTGTGQPGPPPVFYSARIVKGRW